MISNLKELRSLLKLCREHGVAEINLGNISLKLGDLPPKEEPAAADRDEDFSNPYDGFPNEAMSPERLQWYAMGGSIEGDPFKGENE